MFAVRHRTFMQIFIACGQEKAIERSYFFLLLLLLSICFRKLKTRKGASCLPGFWNLINSPKQKVLSEGVKCAWIGQRTLTPLIYPNKHSFSLPPLSFQGLSHKSSTAPLPRTFNTAQPAAFSAFTTRGDTGYTLTHTRNQIAGWVRLRKQHVREGSAEASGNAEFNSMVLSSEGSGRELCNR